MRISSETSEITTSADNSPRQLHRPNVGPRRRMAKHRYYYYDSDSCSFVELKSRRRRLQLQVAGVVSIAVFLALGLTWGMDHIVETPQELALRAENDALQEQLATFDARMSSVSTELKQLGERDQELYRTLFQADPISDDVRQVGVGGSDAYAGFSRFSTSASSILRSTAQGLDRLELQVGLQSDSYKELADYAVNYSQRLREMPIIIPAEGRVISGFKMRDHPILKVRRMHYGVDINVNSGTPVYASGDGIVLEASRGSGFGNYVKIKHPTAGYVTVYAHLRGFAKGLRRGNPVKRGDLIAFSGNTGLSKSPHLHYEVRDLEGRALNPIYFLAPSLTPAAYQEILREAENTSVIFD
ncbi:MAG: murein DD-endopeptidase MepM/ murein hydrolase activator NlpD [Rhodothermales bacterium]|jgi:murein DD-endopeptidase MepM/ murein hydrolase activator NlpD